MMENSIKTFTDESLNTVNGLVFRYFSYHLSAVVLPTFVYFLQEKHTVQRIRNSGVKEKAIIMSGQSQFTNHTRHTTLISKHKAFKHSKRRKAQRVEKDILETRRFVP